MSKDTRFLTDCIFIGKEAEGCNKGMKTMFFAKKDLTKEELYAVTKRRVEVEYDSQHDDQMKNIPQFYFGAGSTFGFPKFMEENPNELVKWLEYVDDKGVWIITVEINNWEEQMLPFVKEVPSRYLMRIEVIQTVGLCEGVDKFKRYQSKFEDNNRVFVLGEEYDNYPHWYCVISDKNKDYKGDRKLEI